jgi:hypothetical protein
MLQMNRTAVGLTGRSLHPLLRDGGVKGGTPAHDETKKKSVCPELFRHLGDAGLGAGLIAQLA